MNTPNVVTALRALREIQEFAEQSPYTRTQTVKAESDTAAFYVAKYCKAFLSTDSAKEYFPHIQSFERNGSLLVFSINANRKTRNEMEEWEEEALEKYGSEEKDG